MPESAPVPDPEPIDEGPLAGTHRWTFEVLASARAHLFVGDAAGAPASLSMLESVPGTGRALLVVDDDDQVQPSPPGAAVSWLVGATADQVESALVAEAAAAGPGAHAYLAGERSDIARSRDVLVGAGLTPEQISAKAYWSRGAANAAHGEPIRQA